MDGCICMGLCVCSWMAKEGVLSSTFLTSVRVSRGTPLSILAQRAVSVKTCKTQRKGTKDISQLGVRFQGQIFKPKMRGWSVGFKIWVQNCRRAVLSQKRTRSSEDNGQMNQYLW